MEYYCELCGCKLKAHERKSLNDIDVCVDCFEVGIDYS
jgi:hypothetical protein